MPRKLAEVIRGPLTLAQCVQLACLLEATARKPGNVHPQADFTTLRFVDLVVSALAIGPVLERVREIGVGQAVLECVRRTH